MTNHEVQLVDHEGRKALANLVQSIAFASFIIFDVMNDPEFSDLGPIYSEAEVAEIGKAVARSTELIATSIATGSWGSDAHQESFYIASIEPWLKSLKPDEQESIRSTLYT